jgi:hypothetical protein
MERDAVAILWDIDDVTPTIVAPFVRGLLRYARTKGRLSLMRVYGDWSKPGNAALAEALAEESFELLHLPASRRQTAPARVGAYTVDLLHTHPHIGTLIVLSGSSALNPMLQVIRSRDLRTVVLCDARNASEELLLNADEIGDFRDVTEVPAEATDGGEGEAHVGVAEAYELLEEAVIGMEERGIRPTLEAVRVRLSLMNDGFDQRQLGFESWHDFIGAAEREGVVRTLFREQDLILTAPRRSRAGGAFFLPEVFRGFLGALSEVLGSTKTSYGNMAKLSAVGQQLSERGIDPAAHGYRQLKRLADAAAKRGLVNVSVKDSGYLLALTQKGRRLAEEDERQER